MKVVVKALKAGEMEGERTMQLFYEVTVKDGSVTVKEVKDLYQSLRCITIKPSDKLLFKGKALKDTNNLDFYGIKNGDKLHYIAGGTNLTTSTTQVRKPFWELLRPFLLKYFTEPDTNKIIECMKKEIHSWIHGVSLDVIEQTALANLGPEASRKS